MDSRNSIISNSRGCPVPEMGQPSFTKSVLDVEVSYYESYFGLTGKTINLLSFLQSKEYQTEVEQIRKIRDKGERDKRKQRLPAITPSGTFSNRSDHGLIKHTGLLQIDIDFKDNHGLNNYDMIKYELAKVSNIAFCSLSVSGTGYWGLVPVSRPDKHREHFTALKRVLRGKGLKIDSSGINISRLRGASYDPTPYFNHHATPFKLFDEPLRDAYEFTYKGHITSRDEATVDAIVSAIENSRNDITSNYREWCEICGSIASTLGEAGRHYFHKISQLNNNYSIIETDKLYSDYLKTGYAYGLGTLIHFCKLYGIRY